MPDADEAHLDRGLPPESVSDARLAELLAIWSTRPVSAVPMGEVVAFRRAISRERARRRMFWRLRKRFPPPPPRPYRLSLGPPTADEILYDLLMSPEWKAFWFALCRGLPLVVLDESDDGWTPPGSRWGWGS